MSNTAEDHSSSGLIHIPNPANENENDVDRTASELFYVSCERSLKALCILSQGLVDEVDDQLVDYSSLPRSSVEKSSAIKPNAVKLQAEVLHHMALDEDILIAPHPKAWTTTRAIKWLNNHPVTEEM
jgi:hypothetical protein